MSLIKSTIKISKIAYSSKVLANMLEELKDFIREGVNLLEIEAFIKKYIKKHRGRPSFKGWMDYPAASCLSVNEVVIHGIPYDYNLRNGDIIGVDVGMEKDGAYGDTAYTYLIGDVKPKIIDLCKVTEESLYIGIKQAVNGNRIGDISYAIQSFVESHGYSLVREYTGHGVGDDVWEEPKIPNTGKAGYGPRLKPNMVIAIEPMVNMGTYKIDVLPDEWTVVTKDRKPSAHYEHTILITDGAPVILTVPGKVE